MLKKRPLHLLVLARQLMLFALLCLGNGVNAAETDTLNVLAFGSCNHSHLQQPLWPIIESHKPDLFLWTGDVVYADTTDATEMRRKYQLQLDVPAYKQFRDNVSVVGIWDDHDYGINNGGKENPIKAIGQQIFLDFMDEPANTVRRSQQGIFTSYSYGSGDQKVKLYLLDTRYHRELTGTGRAELLGADQWQWLEQEMRASDAVVNIFVSGVSVMSPQVPFAEEWRDFKWERKRLFKLIDKHKLSGVLFLTGDRHFSSHLTGRFKGKDFHEFMSSGLTHYMNRPRVSRIFRHIYGTQNSYFGKNFSKITFHWKQQPLQLVFEVFDTENNRRVEKGLSLVGGYWAE